MRLSCNPLVVSREHGRAGAAPQNALVSSRHRLARREAHGREPGESLGPHPVDAHRQGVRHTRTTWPLASALARTHPTTPVLATRRRGRGRTTSHHGRPRSPAGTYSPTSLMFFSKIPVGSAVMRLPSNFLVVLREHGRACAAPQNALVSTRHRLARREAHGHELRASSCGCTQAGSSAHVHDLAVGCCAGPHTPNQPGTCNKKEGAR